MKNLLLPKNISSIQLLFSELFSKTITFTKFLPKIRERELLYIISTLLWRKEWEIYFHLSIFRENSTECSPIISRNFCWKTVSNLISWFPRTLWRKLLVHPLPTSYTVWENFFQTNFFHEIILSQNVTLMEFCWKIWERISCFSHCVHH